VGEKFFVRTFGCQMNEHDSMHLAALLSADGMEATEDLEDADVVVLNTCCIRENADNKLYGHLGQLKSLQARKPGLQIAVGGCLAQKDREAIQERAPYVDVVFGTHNLARAPGLLREARQSGRRVIEIVEDGATSGEADFPSALAVARDSPHAAWVTIQMGCDNSCAFCIVPAVRGAEVSRPMGELLREVEELARSGTVEVTLLGQNVNSYGRDIATRLRSELLGEHEIGPDGRLPVLGRQAPSAALLDEALARAGKGFASESRWRPRALFPDLLRAIGAIPGIRRVRFTSPHPKDLSRETIAAMAETDAVCPQLHLPLQSGSDATLRAMRRGYTTERYLARLAEARAAIPDLAVTTDLIVGFPGESDDDFEATLEVVAEASYDSAYTFVFSPRGGTRAAAMTAEFVPKEVIADRFSRLKIVVDRSALKHNLARVGRQEEVLFEGVSRKDETVASGRTAQGKLVHVAGRREHRLNPGRFGIVEITAAGAHHLIGELISAEPEARGGPRESASVACERGASSGRA